MGVLSSVINYFLPKTTAEIDNTIRDEAVANNVKKYLAEDDIVASIPLAFYFNVSGKSLNIKTATQDKEYNEKINLLMKDFFKRENFEVTQRVNFDEWCRIWAYHYQAFGGILVRHHFNSDFKYGYKPECLDVNRIANDYNDNGFVNGFKYDKWNAIKAIRIYKDNTFNESITVPYSELTLLQTPLEDIHRYTPLSKITSSLVTARKLKEYNDAIIETQKQAAKRGVVIKSQFYADEVKRLQDRYKILFKKNDPESKYEAEKIKKQLDNLLVLQELNSDINIIPQGDDVVSTNMLNNINYTEIGGESKKVISSANGLSPIDVFNENPSSYSNSQMGGKKSNNTYSITAQKLFEDFIRLILENMIRGMRNKGLIDAPDLEQNISKYANFVYFRTEIGHIDPTKDAKATTEYLNQDIKTLEEVLHERGVDMKAHFKSLIRSEAEKVKALKEIKKMYEEEGLEFNQKQAENVLTDEVMAQFEREENE